MSTYFNADGEPTMTAAQARFEADLDAMPDVDDFYTRPVEDEDYYYDHPDECPHDDRTYKANGCVDCDLCDQTVGTWERDADGWPTMTVSYID